MPDSSRSWRAHVIDAVPLGLLTHAYEVAVSGALAVIALPLVVGRIAPASIHDQVPAWQAMTWAWALLAGCGLTLVGIFQSRPRAEWVGQMALGYALEFYALAIVVEAGLVTGGVAAGVFTGIGLVAHLRAFLITSAPFLQHRLIRAAREAQIHAVTERVAKDSASLAFDNFPRRRRTDTPRDPG